MAWEVWEVSQASSKTRQHTTNKLCSINNKLTRTTNNQSKIIMSELGAADALPTVFINKYVVPPSQVAQLRSLFIDSLDEMIETGGHFEVRSLTSNCFELHVHRDESSDVDESLLSVKRLKGRSVSDGTAYGGYTLCEFNDDHPFTYHMHPIEADDRGCPINIPNLVSNEDMIGVVQDNVHNSGYLSNPNGRSMFDILCCPMGLFVYAPEPQMIQKWISMEDEINEDNVVQLMKMFDPRFTKRKLMVRGMDETIQQVKHLIQTDRSESNDFWATEENSLMNSAFNIFIGSWYYTNKKKGFFYKEIMAHYGTLGYQIWSSTRKVKSKDPDHDRANLPVKEQIAWFTSEDFMKIEWHTVPMLQKYLSRMRQEGFYIEFFNWSSVDTGIEFIL